ncbi:MAG: HEAT repeat domain-containing protein, partial [Planctomycetota bacterium]|nr:HEAT repeat domain-containing protein [Planctomycetota bacterium]
MRDALPVVRQAALHTIALHRDAESAAMIMEQLLNWRPATQRVACEALGRLGRKEATTLLLNLADETSDRMLEHSIVYALIELEDQTTLTKALSDPQPGVQRAAAIALDQLEVSEPVQRWVMTHLGHPDERREKTAKWILQQHPEWGGQLAGRVSGWLDQMAAQQTLVERFRPWLGTQLKSEAATRSVAEWMLRQVGESGWTHRVWLPLQLAPPEGFDRELAGVLIQGMSEASSETLVPMWDWLSQSNGGLS